MIDVLSELNTGVLGQLSHFIVTHMNVFLLYHNLLVPSRNFPLHHTHTYIYIYKYIEKSHICSLPPLKYTRKLIDFMPFKMYKSRDSKRFPKQTDRKKRITKKNRTFLRLQKIEPFSKAHSINELNNLTDKKKSQ